MAAVMLLTAGCSAKKTEDAGAESSAAVSEEAGTEASEEQSEAETEEYIAEGSITLGEYMGIPVTVTKPAVTDEEVELVIQNYLNSSATYEESDEEAQLGDIVNIDYKGLLNGTAFEGGTDEGYDLTLGSGRFIDGFEDGLVGVKKGEKRDLNLTFPDPYQNEDLAGKDVVFEVTVNAVKKRVVPELNDEFVATVSPEDGTVEKFRESVHEMLLTQKQVESDNQRDTDLINAIVEASEIVCATDDVDEAQEVQINAYTNMAAGYGIDLATYAGLMGMDEDGFKAELREAAREMVKQEMVLKEIAAKENITVGTEEQEELAKKYGYESLEKFLEAGNVTAEMVEDTALMQKTLDFLVEHAEITETEAAAGE